jgi:hypothetical protein
MIRVFDLDGTKLPLQCEEMITVRLLYSEYTRLGMVTGFDTQ